MNSTDDFPFAEKVKNLAKQHVSKGGSLSDEGLILAYVENLKDVFGVKSTAEVLLKALSCGLFMAKIADQNGKFSYSDESAL